MKKSTKTLLLYIAESLVNDLKADANLVRDKEEIENMGKIVESWGRYLQGSRSGPGYMKMTKSEFLSLHKILGDDTYENYALKADEIEEEGGFLPE